MLISIIGAGGKTTALKSLAHAAAEQRVLITTTTHMYPIEPPESRVLLPDPQAQRLISELKRPGIVCAGALSAGGKLSALPKAVLAQAVETAELTLCEADGSRGLPLKLHRPDEPVMPKGTDRCLIVAGLSAFGRTVKEAVHRYDQNPLWKAQPECIIGVEEMIFCILETVHAAHLPHDCIRILLNQADVLQDANAVCSVQSELLSCGLDCRVGSLRRDESFLFQWMMQ